MQATPDAQMTRTQLLASYQRIRRTSEHLCEPLQTDDYQVQSVIQTSPPKWHIAHVSWLFEAFILQHFDPAYRPFNDAYDFIFNSYYYTHGQMFARARRGVLSRPTVSEVYAYRQHVDQAVTRLIHSCDDARWPELAFYLVLGLNHEQQHQELLLMDIKHNFFCNPLWPAYRSDLPQTGGQSRPLNWVERAGGQYSIGYSGDGFAYDNETPRHPLLLQDHRLADRLVTNAEYLAFINDGGYRNPALWLSDGWTLINREQWQQPLYWQQQDNDWQQFTLAGMRPLNPHEPVCHISFYEAYAYARWAGKRLPLESELEVQLSLVARQGNFIDSGLLHPGPAGSGGQWFGDLWNWTASPYTAYPGFRPLAGSVGEYNGKFMSNQMVLKGGCCITPAEHTRASYRNFFYPDERWAFTGLRLAEEA